MIQAPAFDSSVFQLENSVMTRLSLFMQLYHAGKDAECAVSRREVCILVCDVLLMIHARAPAHTLHPVSPGTGKLLPVICAFWASRLAEERCQSSARSLVWFWGAGDVKPLLLLASPLFIFILPHCAPPTNTPLSLSHALALYLCLLP